jgi:hypothetical protein
MPLVKKPLNMSVCRRLLVLLLLVFLLPGAGHPGESPAPAKRSWKILHIMSYHSPTARP